MIVLATVLAAGAAFITSRLQVPVYQATTQLLIDQAPNTQTSDYTDILTSERQARTYAQLITNRPVLEETLVRLGDGISLGAFEDAIDVQLIRDTQLIEVSVEHTSSIQAANLANMLVTVFSEQNAEPEASRFLASKESLSAQLVRLDEQIQETQNSIDEIGEPKTPSEESEIERLKSELAPYQTSYTDLLQSFEQLRLAEAQSVSNVVQVEPAIIPTNPIRPRVLMNTALAGVVGAMLAVGTVFLIEYLDDTVKSTEEASQALGLPIIGFFARNEDIEDEKPIVVSEPRSPISEAFRSLRTNIQFAGVDKPIRTLLVTSPGPEEGKTTVAANLAIVLAQGGKKVLLLDADMRKPRIHRIMDLPNKLGVSDFFKHPTRDLRSAVQKWGDAYLDVVTSGEVSPNPAELLGSEKMSQILDMFKGKYDFVVIDSPPVGVVTDPTVLSACVDGTLLVVEPNKTKLGAAIASMEQLRRADANVIGVVFNNVSIKRAGYYTGYDSGYYYYQYAYSYVESEDGKEPGRFSSLRAKQGKKKA